MAPSLLTRRLIGLSLFAVTKSAIIFRPNSDSAITGFESVEGQSAQGIHGYFQGLSVAF